MTEKTAVSAVHEYCAKHNWPNPSYEFIQEKEGFVCEITVFGEFEMTAQGTGRSKRDAKHNGCTLMMKRLRQDDPDMEEVTILEQAEMPGTDMIVTLRDFCVRHNHPLPCIEIIQQSGTPDAPEFIALCTLASIKRYGVSAKKKDARQKAALEMYKVINENGAIMNCDVARVDDAMLDVEAERYQKFKTYRELTDSKTGEVPGITISDRHNYFYNFYPHLKTEALAILRDDNCTSDEEKCMRALRALKITPKISKLPMEDLEDYLFIEFNCEYDAVMAGPECDIYKHTTQYLIDMLT